MQNVSLLNSSAASENLKDDEPKRQSNTQPSDLESDEIPLRQGSFWLNYKSKSLEDAIPFKFYCIMCRGLCFSI
ncbi:hypothetical protein O6P43_025129 [Quillaja saponaria]|uniref:Uncharacterized protein n=1 Tax=Quillaja saponaria TaxID=32244 RepID=A0AAD7L877_QUISA|nr:hypothetical protein O6P43_025129 [Quillaja saponaria]